MSLPPSKKKDVCVVKLNDTFAFAKVVKALEVSIEWSSLKGGFCDLDVLIYLYDDNARFIEKLDFDNPVSRDGAFTLMADMDNTKESKTHEEQVHVDFTNVCANTSSAIVFIDGGTRNFQHANGITARVTRKNIHLDGASNFSASLDNIKTDCEDLFLFESSCVTRKDYQAVLGLVLHKTGFHDDDSVAWSCKAVFDPVMVTLSRDKDEVCEKAIVNHVPALYQYRPRLFPSVQAICAELSSKALPNLKRLFTLDSNGLPIDDFTKVIFMQLYEVNNGVAVLSEAEYTVAMLHELFGQIDYNGDGFVDWDEFTTFCIYTGLITDTSKPPTDGSPGGLDDYVIEYTEDKNLKDATNISFAPLALMRHCPTIKKLLVIPDLCNSLLVMNERLGLYATINPQKYIEQNIDKTDVARLKILDVIYIPWKDLICYSASDHSIVFIKELQGHSGKKQVTFNIHHRINHTFLHIKLCWSEESRILCSVNVDNTIFGWEVDSTGPLFQINRHSQKITDFIALDTYGLFATCSLDKRIKLWSQKTRRMKGVLTGHKRGIRFMSHAKDCLLSAGFECEARAWDLDLCEQTLTLRGHRHSLSACKIMSQVDSEDDLRGLTADQSGEFRLWDLFTKKGSDCTFAVTLQTFNNRSDVPVHVNFLAIPYDADYSNGEYSNFIAGTNCLIHFRPEKSVQEFVPPACMIYSETNCCLLSACGKNLLKYDIITGSYQACFSNIGNCEISSLCMDGEHGRRVFVGFTNGFIYMINFATGQILSTVHAHSKGVSCLCLMKSECGAEDVLFTGSNEGTIRIISETNGELDIHTTLEHATGDNAAIGNIVALEHANVIIATSIARCWGVWQKHTLKRAFLLQENDPISGIIVLGGGDRAPRSVVDYTTAVDEASRLIITVAVSVTNSVRIYSLNLQHIKKVEGTLTHILEAQHGLYFSGAIKMSFPATTSLNYKVTNSKASLKDVIVASTDTGSLIYWDIKHTFKESVAQLFDTYPNIISKLQIEFADSVPILAQLSHGELGSISESMHENDDDECMMLDGQESQDDYYSDSECGSDTSDHSHSSLFSLTSAMGTIQDNVKADHTNASSVGMTSFKMAKTSKVVPQNIKHPVKNTAKKAIHEFRKIRRATTINVSGTNNTDIVMGGDTLRKIQPVAMWKAHKDSIINIQLLGDSGCFATISLDGFHRVWNLQRDCLGVLALPNLTDEMKQQTEESNLREWIFLKEKIPVKPMHTLIAKQFLTHIAERDKNNENEMAGRRDRRNAVDNSSSDNRKHIAIKTNDEGRNSILMSLLLPQANASPNLPPVPGSTVKIRKASQLLSADEQKHITSFSETLPPIDKKASGNSSPSKEKTPSRAAQKADKDIEALKRKVDKRLRSASVPAASSGSLKSEALSSSKYQKKRSKTVFHSDNEWDNANDFMRNPVNAFSSSSITDGYKDGVLDDESHKLLRILNKDEFRTKAFDRVIPGVLLRNVAMSTTFKFPDSDVCHSEVNFGQQKEMYKNANHIINAKHKVSSVSSNMNARHSLALLRLKQDIGKAGPMTQICQVPLYDDISSIALQDEVEEDEYKDDDDDNDESNDHYIGSCDDESKQKKVVRKQSVSEYGRKKSVVQNARKQSRHAIRTSTPNGQEASKLNMEKLEGAMKKVMDAENDNVPHYIEVEVKRRKELKLQKSRRLRQSDSHHSKSTIVALERKLIASIKRFHADKKSKALSPENVMASFHEEKFVLKARDLIPHYKLSDVKDFLNAFFLVDKNLSGYLDLEEWVAFFQAMNESMTAQAARLLFSHVDVNGDGVLSLHELVPVIFAEASPHQVKLILKFIDDEITRSMSTYNIIDVYKEDLAILFEAYDSDNIGYIKVHLIRDKLMRFQLPVAAQMAFNEKLRGIEDDDMMNLPEFTRMFLSYLSLEPRDGSP